MNDYWACEALAEREKVAAIPAPQAYDRAMSRTREDPRLHDAKGLRALERGQMHHQGIRSGIDDPKMDQVYHEHLLDVHEGALKGPKAWFGRAFKTKGHQERVHNASNAAYWLDSVGSVTGANPGAMDRVKNQHGWSHIMDFDTHKDKAQKAEWFRPSHPDGTMVPSYAAMLKKKNLKSFENPVGGTTVPTVDPRAATATIAPRAAPATLGSEPKKNNTISRAATGAA